MRDAWMGDFEQTQEWVDQVLAPDTDDAGGDDMNQPVAIFIENPPAGGIFRGLDPVQVTIGNKTTSNVTGELFDRMAEIAARYPAAPWVSFRLVARSQSVDGRLVDVQPYLTPKFTRVVTASSAVAPRAVVPGPPAPLTGGRPAGTGTGSMPTREVQVHNSDGSEGGGMRPQDMMILATTQQLMEVADRSSRREGRATDRLADILEKKDDQSARMAQSMNEQLVAVHKMYGQQILAISIDLAKAGAERDLLSRDLERERTGRTEDRKTLQAAFGEERRLLTERVEELAEELESAQDSASAAEERLSELQVAHATLTVRHRTVESTHKDLIERYNEACKVMKRLKKKVEAGGGGEGGGMNDIMGMVRSFQEVRAQMAPQAETTPPAAAPAPAQITARDRVAADVEDVFDAPAPVIGAIRPVRPVTRRRLESGEMKPAGAGKDTSSAAPPAMGFPDLQAVTPTQAAMIFQMLPEGTRKGAIEEMAKGNPAFANEVYGDFRRSLGVEEGGAEEDEEDDEAEVDFDLFPDGAEDEDEDEGDDEEEVDPDEDDADPGDDEDEDDDDDEE